MADKETADSRLWHSRPSRRPASPSLSSGTRQILVHQNSRSLSSLRRSRSSLLTSRTTRKTSTLAADSSARSLAARSSSNTWLVPTKLLISRPSRPSDSSNSSKPKENKQVYPAFSFNRTYEAFLTFSANFIQARTSSFFIINNQYGKISRTTGRRPRRHPEYVLQRPRPLQQEGELQKYPRGRRWR